MSSSGTSILAANVDGEFDAVNMTKDFAWRLLRDSIPWGLLIGGALVIRYAIDIVLPRGDVALRASVLSYTMLAIYMTAATRCAWRAGSIGAAVALVVTASLVGGLVSVVGAGLLLAIWHDPETLETWRAGGGFDEVFISMPFDLFCIGILLGIAGGALGKYTRLPFTRRPA